MAERKVQPVSFNLEDAYERDLYQYALEQQKFFSRYVKRLIEADRSGAALKQAPAVAAAPAPAPVSKVSKTTAAGFL